MEILEVEDRRVRPESETTRGFGGDGEGRAESGGTLVTVVVETRG